MPLTAAGRTTTRMEWAGHMDVSREAAAGHTAERAAAAGGMVLLMLGWSVLEGAGAALIMPAMVALVASNFARDQRPARTGWW